ncbi:MAG: Holliday junction resolvase RuvX [Acidimicrobiia bacterium]|nr:Holliday junction resolvase RuvX [Acidimicrobiia bacterium]MBT8247866.1 Holliday junction resolvase RuvX [Acidimicrobiia bacterium]NNF88568.1 Holliday junction resolvase RuvX [Acidimicrobiia bacterium]NNJ48543.1 Holliday junction resolvase RuvX [Acidimicrobiia bacterium]NNL14539.1 Holliday junction resolvase RuvX [Acidimicrobiia bacterium]
MGRLLGLDYGTRRVGVAICDSSRLIASPYAVLEASDVLAGLDEILSAEDIEGIVVGLPVSLSGQEGQVARAARSFAETVGSHTGLPVELVDERFTTKVAEDVLIQGGVRRSKRRDIRDKMAATVMLQGHLDSLR